MLAAASDTATTAVILLSVIGLAVQMGVVMVVYIDDAFHRRLGERDGDTRQYAPVPCPAIADFHADGASSLSLEIPLT